MKKIIVFIFLIVVSLTSNTFAKPDAITTDSASVEPSKIKKMIKYLAVKAISIAKESTNSLITVVGVSTIVGTMTFITATAMLSFNFFDIIKDDTALLKKIVGIRNYYPEKTMASLRAQQYCCKELN